VVAARGELMREISLMSMQLRGVLTIDQWRDLQKRRRAMREGRRPGMGPRRGGGVPPGGPQPDSPPPRD
jgi:hypothetical protein